MSVWMEVPDVWGHISKRWPSSEAPSVGAEGL